MPKAKLYRARYLLPIAAEPLEDGALLVEGKRITAVGPFAALRRADAELVDCGDAVLLPPFANAHTHLELTHYPRWQSIVGETAAPGSFVDWILQVIRVKRRMVPDRYLLSLQEGIRLALAAGTGAVGDILSCFPARSAYAPAPLKGRLYYETLGLDPARNRELLRTIGELLDKGRVGFLEPGISPHSPYTLSAEYLEEIFDFARRRGVPVATHLAESADEVAFLRDADGPLAQVFYPYVGWREMLPPPARRTPLAYLAERGGLVAGNLLIHGVQVRAADAGRLARAGASVVLCPRSNARLGVGRAPVELYLKQGVPLALGTDSLASCDTLSLWDEIAFARNWFEGRLSPPQLLTMATRNGAAALGLGGEMGVLEVNRGAHFQVLVPPSLPPAADLAEFLCSPGRSAEVAALYLDGRDVLQKG
ncbi:MAG TPA: amidohydrolase family protein [Desulfuromonadales bacterium]|nr:amidohydrolase family protein [Desulfuromonadales bacterium]